MADGEGVTPLAESRGRQGAVRGLRVRGKGRRLPAHRYALRYAPSARCVVARCDIGEKSRLRAGVGGRGASVVPALYVRIHRQTQGHSALLCRLFADCKTSHEMGFLSEGQPWV